MAKKVGEISSIIPKPTVKNIIDRRVTTPIIADSPEFIPKYQTKGAVCCDLRANLPIDIRGTQKLTIAPGHTELVDCGIKIALPEGYEAQIRAKSGWATKGLIVTNATEESEGGSIDFDFHKKIKVILTNVGKSLITIEHLDRIAQMSIRPCWFFDFESVVEFKEPSDRGGFGSTGKN